ncbi:hypothetical protein JCM10908_001161 [Rhodotorula pacifica]|uniref:uncharacterized protein n=1 Tax=Rhodotorula pacifica TaxID=1495444 RepID=UPI00317493E2
MDWDGPRTQFSFWTPSIPSLERGLPQGGVLISTYRLVRTAWLVFTLPLHLALLAASLVAPSPSHRAVLCRLGEFHPTWNPQQRLVYPLLRRVIWAIADIGSADALTPNARFKFPWWAWALEEFTVRVGRGARVRLETTEVEMPAQAWEHGWVQGDVVDSAGEVQFGAVPCFWFERDDRKARGTSTGAEHSLARKARENERIVLYFVGGGYVTGSPTEGSRCFKLARETGLRVVGANFRKATSSKLAFPAQLQDALTVYAHLTLELGFKDIVLAGDSAGGNLALMLVQCLAALKESHTIDDMNSYSDVSSTRPSALVMPTGLLLFSPWCDLTAATYGEALIKRRGQLDDPKHDIICASMATNSIRLFLVRILAGGTGGGKRGSQLREEGEGSVAKKRGAHPWFSPSLPSADSSWARVTRVYTTNSGIGAKDTSRPRSGKNERTTPLRVLVTTGRTELFNLETTCLCSTLRRAGSQGGIEVDCVSAEGEVHAFPLVPEWVSPEAAKAWNGAENGTSNPEELSHTYHIPNNFPRSPSPLPFSLPSAHSSSSSHRDGKHPDNYANDTHHAAASRKTNIHTRATNDDRQQEAPGVVQSLRNFILSGWINILIVAVPLSFISHFARWGSTADFIISFIAIVPLASLLGDATEQCSLKVGQTVGGLLNATFGNAVELIVGILALTRGELRIVQTSLLGSILSNLLLVLGCSFLVGGTRFKEQTFQMTAVQASSSLMVLGCATLVIPAAYRSSQLDGSLDQDKGGSLMGLAAELGSKKDITGLLKLSRGTAIILLICYACYLFFQLRTHHYLFQDPNEEEEEEAKMNIYTAIGALVVVTVITSFCADYLVGAIDEFAQDYNIPKAFIGLILLPIVGNAAEHVTSVWMAAKGKMELTIGVAIGSSIQIAVGLIPALVIVGWIINQDLTLFFENFETIVLFVSVLLVDILVSDGRSHWLEGAQLIALYLVIALAFWFTG